MTGLLYIGCEPYGFDNSSFLLLPDSVLWRDAAPDLKQLTNGEPGLWRYPNNLRQQWRAQAENKWRAAMAAATKGKIGTPRYLGLIVDSVGKTVRRDGKSTNAVVYLAERKFWPVFEAIYKAGPSGIEPRVAYELYDGSREDCRMAVHHYRGVFTRLGVTITNRKWTLIDIKDFKNPETFRS